MEAGAENTEKVLNSSFTNTMPMIGIQRDATIPSEYMTAS